MLNPKRVPYYAISRFNDRYIDTDHLYYSIVSIDPADGGLKLNFSGPTLVPLVTESGLREPQRVQKTLKNLNLPTTKYDGKSSKNIDVSALAGSRQSKKLCINSRDELHKNPCYFAFILSNSVTNWHFDLFFLAITSKDEFGHIPNSVDREVDQLLLFDKSVNFIDLDSGVYEYKFDHDSNMDNTDCRIAAFGIRRMPFQGRRKVNLHVTFGVGADERVPTVFDPDIKNDGNGFP